MYIVNFLFDRWLKKGDTMIDRITLELPFVPRYGDFIDGSLFDDSELYHAIDQWEEDKDYPCRVHRVDYLKYEGQFEFNVTVDCDELIY